MEHLNSEKKHDIEHLLNNFGKVQSNDRQEIIYGISDNSGGLRSKFNDYFIDRSKIKVKDKAYFFHLMAVMLDAGLALIETLKILSRRTTNERFSRILNTIAYHVEHGMTLSKAMSYFPEVFTDAETGIIKSGEAIGHLDKMLFKLSEQTERSYDLTLKIKTALVYPVLVFISLLAAGAVLMFVVIPKLIAIFESSKAQLPLSTRIFVGISDFLINFWWAISILAVLAYIFFRVYENTTTGKLKIDYFKLKLPIVGDLVKKLLIAKFVNMLEIMVSAGMSITKILEITASAMGNEVYRLMILQIKNKVEQGEKISDNMAIAPFLFPEEVSQMIRIGEQSASLDRSANKLAKHFETEAEHSVKRLTAAFEPIVIILIAVVVGLVAMAILGPIFSLTEVL